MKKFLALVLAVSMLLALAACGKKDPTPTPDDQQNPDTESEYPVMTIRLAHDAPLTTPHHEAAEKIKAALEEKSGGKITVEVYPNQQFGSASEMIESQQMNTVEMVLLPTSKYGGFYPTLNIMDMPFLVPTQESTMKLFKSELATEMMAGLEDIGIALEETADRIKVSLNREREMKQAAVDKVMEAAPEQKKEQTVMPKRKSR